MGSMSIKKKEILVGSHSLSDNIILTGFMGCGKSYFSSELADALSLDLFDTDALIEAKVHMAIKEIFLSHDEAYFRSLESDIAIQIQRSTTPAVYATGGGFPIHYEDILDIGKVFYMDIPFETILERMNDDERDKRPLFQDVDKAKALYDSRLEIYKKRSHYHIDATQSITAMISFVKEKLNID